MLEKANGVRGIAAADFGWNDVGSWNAVYELLERDAHGNVIALDVQRAIEHGDPCVFVYLVIGEELVLLEGERDHPGRTVIRSQDLGPPGFGREGGDFPNVHRDP